MKSYTLIFACMILLLVSCSGSVNQEDLYGRWDYVKVKNADPEDIMTDEEVKQQSPAIIFAENNDLIIEWDGKKLSHGKFRLDGKMIRYTEFLDAGRKRDFPFLIERLTDTELVFVTMEKNYTRVTARRVN